MPSYAKVAGKCRLNTAFRRHFGYGSSSFNASHQRFSSAKCDSASIQSGLSLRQDVAVAFAACFVKLFPPHQGDFFHGFPNLPKSRANTSSSVTPVWSGLPNKSCVLGVTHFALPNWLWNDTTYWSSVSSSASASSLAVWLALVGIGVAESWCFCGTPVENSTSSFSRARVPPNIGGCGFHRISSRTSS